MKKNFPYIFWTISVTYIVFNFKRIRGAFLSDVWSKEIGLETHVASYNVQLQVISILLVVGSLILAFAYWKKIQLSNFILWPISITAIILWINTQIDFIRWIEINVFGAGALLIFTIGLIINLIWRVTRSVKSKP